MNKVFGLRRKFKKGNDYYCIFTKPWTAKLGIPFEGKLKYMLVRTTDFKKFKIIDEAGENDGFEDYIGAEQFLRAYLTGTYKEVPHRWHINLFKNKPNGYLEYIETGDEIEY